MIDDFRLLIADLNESTGLKLTSISNWQWATGNEEARQNIHD